MTPPRKRCRIQPGALQVSGRRPSLSTAAVRVDVADENSVDVGFASVRELFGPVEILVTSAAIAGFTRFDKITLDEWLRGDDAR